MMTSQGKVFWKDIEIATVLHVKTFLASISFLFDYGSALQYYM